VGEAPAIDVFADLSSLSPQVQLSAWNQLIEHGDLREIGGCFTIVSNIEKPKPLPFRAAVFSADRGAVALRKAKRAAALADRGLIVLLRGATIGPEAARRLPAALQDPMLGCVEPRFLCGDNSGIVALPPDHREGRLLSRRLVAALPAAYVSYDHLAACLYVDRLLIANLPDDIFDDAGSGEEAVAILVTEARRRGFRTVVDNRHFAEVTSARDAYPELAPDAVERFRARYPEYNEAMRRLAELPHRRREAAIAAGLDARHGNAENRRLVLDCKGIPAAHNGTSEAVLGILDGLARLETPWRTELLVSPDAQTFHDLQRRYPQFRQLLLPPQEPAPVAIRLSQPFDISTICELHQCGLRIGTLILDTIAWDIAWTDTHHFDRCLRLSARHFDALLYNSKFSQERFAYRFGPRPGIRQVVIHHSFHASDYVRGQSGWQREGPILLFGNAYPHKAIGETLDLLRRGFPFQPVTVLGGPPIEQAEGGSISRLPSGYLRAEEIDRLYAGARLLLYPSYYEGFGLPVVRGLNQGLDVLVRRSALATEIAAHCRAPGSLFVFKTPAEMVELIGRVLAGAPVEPLVQGAAIPPGEEPLDWVGVARRIIDLADGLLAEKGMQVYDERDAVLRLMRPDGFL